MFASHHFLLVVTAIQQLIILTNLVQLTQSVSSANAFLLGVTVIQMLTIQTVSVHQVMFARYEKKFTRFDMKERVILSRTVSVNHLSLLAVTVTQQQTTLTSHALLTHSVSSASVFHLGVIAILRLMILTVSVLLEKFAR